MEAGPAWIGQLKFCLSLSDPFDLRTDVYSGIRTWRGTTRDLENNFLMGCKPLLLSVCLL